MARKTLHLGSLLLVAVIACAIVFSVSRPVEAQGTGPTILDPHLAVRTVVGGLTTPTSLAFLGNNDMLVLEKNTGQVKRVVNGSVQSTVLDLAVNFASER